jgi:hypothetical protein
LLEERTGDVGKALDRYKAMQLGIARESLCQEHLSPGVAYEIFLLSFCAFIPD